MTLTLKGFEPQQEAIVYYDWQLGFAGRLRLSLSFC